MRLLFQGVSKSIVLRDTDELADAIFSVLHGWQIDSKHADETPPAFFFSKTDDGYHYRSNWLSKPAIRKHKADIVCVFIADFVQAYLEEDPTRLCLHCAAIAFGGHLVVFPNYYHAGKSLLSASLAAAGQKIFADDVLPIEMPDQVALAPGFQPRLREPLPDELGQSFRAFLDNRRGLSSSRYRYLDLSEDRLAKLGTKMEIGAFVLLEREAGAKTEIRPASEAEVLRQVLWRNFARETPAMDILNRLNALVKRAQRYTLRYGSAEEAVPLLQKTFASWPQLPPLEPEPSREIPRSRTTATPLPPGTFLRNPAVTERRIDDGLFLVNPETQGLYHLNVLGTALWNLLAEPTSMPKIVDMIHAAFPDTGRQQVEKDVTALLNELVAKNLILS